MAKRYRVALPYVLLDKEFDQQDEKEIIELLKKENAK